MGSECYWTPWSNENEVVLIRKEREDYQMTEFDVEDTYKSCFVPELGSVEIIICTSNQ